ncbi:hypothetical protein AB0F72_10355 [Actinoplanes sp. NPDC023936]|uniref:hypothetical protein n=1 Tax=Actinoplanes sp. NPDC023936 TaxID=3154910 RepID=UPI0033FA4B5A
MGKHVNQGWQNMDGNGHYWPGQQPGIPPSYYAGPTDPLVSADYNGWCRRGAALVKQIWKPALLLHAVIAVPTVALTLPTQNYMLREQQDASTALDAQPTELPPLGDLAVAFALLMVAALIAGVIYVIATSATVQLVVQAATGRPISLGAALRTALRRTPALLGWYLLLIPICLVAIMLCVLPVFYVAAATAILPVVVTVERGTGIGRCFQLFHANVGVSAGRIATYFGVAIAAALAIAAISAVAQLAGGASAGLAADAVLNGLYSVAFAVVGTPFVVAAYADMRSRREPFSTAYLMAS